jgi:hypothetical protein
MSEIEYIYLIQEREFIKTNESIYKIGRTKAEHNKRASQYPKGSVLIFQQICKHSLKTENAIIKEFKKSFNQRKDIGKEYFEGDSGKMTEIIIDIIKKEGPVKVKKTKPKKEEDSEENVIQDKQPVPVQDKQPIPPPAPVAPVIPPAPVAPVIPPAPVAPMDSGAMIRKILLERYAKANPHKIVNTNPAPLTPSTAREKLNGNTKFTALHTVGGLYKTKSKICKF